MFGSGVWVPDSWVTDDASQRSAVIAALQDRATRATRQGGRIIGTSISLPEDAVTGHLAMLADPVFLPTEAVARSRQKRSIKETTGYVHARERATEREDVDQRAKDILRGWPSCSPSRYRPGRPHVGQLFNPAAPHPRAHRPTP